MTEIECDYPTKKISESFIEDVSTVLDQLEDYVSKKKFGKISKKHLKVHQQDKPNTPSLCVPR